MRKPVEKRVSSARVLALVGALFGGGLLGCQSAPAASKEPPSQTPPAAAAAQPAAQSQGALQGTGNETAAVKLTGGQDTEGKAAAPASGEPAAATTEPAAAKDEPSAPPAQALANEGSNKAGAGKAPAADKPAAKEKAGATAKAPEAKTVQGNVVNEEPFSAWLQVASPAKAGDPLQVEAVLVAKPPYHCNEEYPHKFKLAAPPAGLSYPEETVRGMKVTPERGVLAIPVNAQSAGKPTVAGTLSFSVCTEERCLVEKRELSVSLDVM